MNRQNSSDANEWTDCSPGTLAQLNHRLRSAQQRKTMMRVGLPVVLLAFIGFGVLLVNRSTTPADFNFGGVTCTQVQSDLNQYALGQLSFETQNAFEIHLAKCPRCQEQMRAMLSESPMPTEVGVEQRREKTSAESSASHRQLLAALVE